MRELDRRSAAACILKHVARVERSETRGSSRHLDDIDSFVM